MITARTLSLTLLTTALLLPLASAHVFASQMPARIERQTADAFDRQQEQLARFELETEPRERLAYARFLVDGLITSASNPIRVPAPGSGAEIYRDLLGVDDQRTRIKAAQELRNLLLRFGDDTNFEEISQLEQLLQTETQPAVPETAPVALSEAETEQKLRREMADGSLDAALDLLVLLRRQGSGEAEVVRRQMLYLANIRLIDSDSSVIKLARRYAETLDAEDHPEMLAALLDLAAGSGSDAVMSIVNAHREQLAAGDAANVRDIIWKLVAAGSDRAMEVIALDLVDNAVFGFDRADALWAVSSLEELQNFRANYLIAKLYYQGIHVKRDLPRAISAMERMLAQASSDPELQTDQPKRFSQINFSDELRYRYVLPLYLTSWESGDQRFVTQIARLLVTAERTGLVANTSELPVPVEELLSELEQAYELGNATAGSLLAEIYFNGRMAPKNVHRSSEILSDLLAHAHGNPELTLRIEEQILKQKRDLIETTSTSEGYNTALAQLADRNSLWAMQEYGKLLLAGTEQLPADAERGGALLLRALSKGNLTAGPSLARYAVENQPEGLLVELRRQLAGKDPRVLAPEEIVQVAQAYFELGDFQKSHDLVSAEVMETLPSAIVLHAQAGVKLGLLPPAQGSDMIREVILGYAGSANTQLKFIKAFAKTGEPDVAFAEPVLARLAEIADRRNLDAIGLAFRLRQKWPETQSLSFRKIVRWSRYFAEKGRDGLLNEIARDVDVSSIGKDDFAFLLDNVEDVLAFLPDNHALRVFVANQYLDGEFRKRDFARANELTREAAKVGNVLALHELADNLYYGQGVGMDRRRAMQLYHSLSYVGSGRSSLTLARKYSSGPETGVYEPRALAHFAVAASGGSLAAMTELGRTYLAHGDDPETVAKGLSWLHRSAELGSIDAAVQLYFYHFLQNPTDSNPEAEKWLDSLVEHEVPDMIIRKAVLLRERDPDGNREEVDRLLHEAEALGTQFARRLRNMYLEEDRAGAEK